MIRPPKPRKEKRFMVDRKLVLLPIILLMMILMVGLTKPYITLGSNYNSEITILSSGGTNISSAAYDTTVAISQTAIGDTSSANYKTYLGFFHAAVEAEGATPPTIVLLTPTEMNTSIHDLTPLFTWDGNDADGDNLSYKIWLNNESDFSSPLMYNTTSFENVTSSLQLDLDTMYFWVVEVADGKYLVNSSVWNFTTESYAAIEMVVNLTDFGVMEWNWTNSTEDDNPVPLRVRNIGNIPVDLTIYANDSLWTVPRAPLNTSYFRFKADNRTEPASFNRSASQITWTNVTDYNVTLLQQLNWTESFDEAEIDLEITVPWDEVWTVKTSTLIIEVP